jgi:hypothetical protein
MIIRIMVFAIVVWFQVPPIAHAVPLGASTEKVTPSMRFAWNSELPATVCGQSCRRWISAVGPITDQTPSDFQAFAAQAFAADERVRGATLVLDSGGGSVAATLALGRTIRALGMNTTVGRIVVTGQGQASIATISPQARCSSMCVFLLLAGVKRHVSPGAEIFVHQIWITNKRNKMLASRYDAEDVARVERDIGKLARYTAEMDGSAELLEIALQVPAWGAMYRLSQDELRRVRLDTTDDLFAEKPLPALAATPTPPVANVLDRPVLDRPVLGTPVEGADTRHN